ncbi:SDR family oxidoreductase [Chromobacterium sphagni]|uniref:Oxidoreductase n=1 Tax=Chromobacterium sphagni TaxID=1903179 RepID=A0A1S1WZV1_9NEIS|nr:SDR family oxidoreductase [Chromobacterium sphagni]OHX12812.1 oxidoreductase [Chromobacterium sphagni]OHX17676.1 oxidoreductase [Chromobacterium sphagni]
MSYDKFNLAGKVAVVTGGAGLLGVRHAQALIEVGCQVFLADIDERALAAACAELGEQALPLALDVTSEASVAAAVEQVLARGGRVDILINNAAIDPKVGKVGLQEPSRLENFSPQQWDRELAVGLSGAFLCSKHFGGWMAANGGGTILNIASDLSVFAPDQRLYRKDGLPDDRQPVKPVTYSVIKTGLIGLTRYLATYWAEAGVRVNALSPGGVFNQQPDEFVAKLSRLIPLGRMAERDEYQGAVLFLCSDASSYMTGQNLVMDGGRSVW